ncbi:MAG: MBL fold metallo-hydrolase [Solirubrobacteraceae bacterium]
MDIRFLGHACFTLADGDTTLLIDPFLTGNPKAAASADDVAATTILLTHGHQDHYGDTIAIGQRTGATVVAITEVAGEIEGEGLEVRNCNLGGKIVYHLGDTCLFSDLELVGKRHPIDVALMCIGGYFTMDRHDAVDAAELVGAKTVSPCHYGTFPPIETDAQAFASEVESATSSTVVILEPGETHTT